MYQESITGDKCPIITRRTPSPTSLLTIKQHRAYTFITKTFSKTVKLSVVSLNKVTKVRQ